MAVIAILTASNVFTLWLFWRAKSVVSAEFPCNVWEVSVKRRTMREAPAVDDLRSVAHDMQEDIKSMIGDML